MSTTVMAEWVGPNQEHVGIDSKGNKIKLGGGDTSPAQMLLIGLAGCMSMDIKHVLSKKRISFDSLRVKVIGHQPDGYPKPFQVVDIVVEVTGSDVSEKSMEKAIALSRDKYCVVGQTLQNVTTINTSYVIKQQ